MIETLKTAVMHQADKLAVFSNIKKGDDLILKGLPGSLKPLMLSLLADHLSRPVLAVLPTYEDAEAFAEALSLLNGEDVPFFPGGDEDPDTPLILNPHRVGSQMQVLRDLRIRGLKMIVASPEGLAMRLPKPSVVDASILMLEIGASFDLYALIERLVDFGYVRESVVERPGEISLRGGILDVFPYTGEPPARVEFFGDEIDSMRHFDVATQRSTGKAEALRMVSSPLAWKERTESLLSYLSDDALLFWQDPDLILAQVEKIHGRTIHHAPGDVAASVAMRQSITLHTITSPAGLVDFGGHAPTHPGQGVSAIRTHLQRLSSDEDVYILCERADRVERIEAFLELDAAPMDRVIVGQAPIRQGFSIPELHLIVYAEQDLLGHPVRKRRKSKFAQGVPIRELSALSRGDLVVHIDYGIGRYQGLEKIMVQEVERECLSLIYQDGDKLYVPLDKMERVQKYSGGGGEPLLTKLGSGRWDKIKARTKKSIQDIAKDLIALYSARRALPGYAFAADSTWQQELESSFAYEDTPDQAKAVDEVKRDMEQARPMDRLVCGDVGYGKTEVAVRAAFKAVNDGKQVAVLVPTTILAQQHYQTFLERLALFPVTVEVLSRFRSRKEQQEVVHQMRQGQVDVVIGTHRLLSKDVGFKDLGLLVVDEEQRFGVRHKERLKAFRQTVDTLILTATPIPRTLQFSLMGIRDMSLITTPPKDRLPIITEVAQFDEEIVIEAIDREVARGGQVFFVHNRVKSIHAVARMIERLVPGIRIAVAHGQMDEKALEKVMVAFGHKQYDCLVSTMIIESGLDLPNVNTLIVHRADRLGLAQLYQLRGRVGRSEKRAYAYLLTPPIHLLSPDAVKRLRTIEEFTELGSGFQIALRDLEIRGAGNLLGMQQSGNMDAVGFELYTRLVDEAINELKAEAEPEESAAVSRVTECKVETDAHAYLPDVYVEDESLRVNLYRRLSSIQQLEEVTAFDEELADRFGPLPKEAETLLRSVELRIIAGSRGVMRVSIHGPTVMIFFDEAWVNRFSSSELFSERLRSMIDSSPVPIRFLPGKAFGIRFSVSQDDPMRFAKKLLHRWG